MSRYFEAHITIEPVYGERLNKLEDICDQLGWRISKFLTYTNIDEPNAFISYRLDDMADIYENTISMYWALINNAFVVKRYKIEDILLDVKL